VRVAVGDGGGVAEGTAVADGATVGVGVLVHGTRVVAKNGIHPRAAGVLVAVRGGARETPAGVAVLVATVVPVGAGALVAVETGRVAAPALSTGVSAGGGVDVARLTVGLASRGARTAAKRGSLGGIGPAAEPVEPVTGGSTWLIGSGNPKLVDRPRSSGCSSMAATARPSSVLWSRSSSPNARPTKPRTQ
jgi:hypothetical protein